MNPVIVWFRHDLRLGDNPALYAAAATKRPLVCLFVHDETATTRAAGGAARWWLHHSLASLHHNLQHHGGGLTILRGATVATLVGLARELGAAAVYWNRRYDGPGRAIDAAVSAALEQHDIEVSTHNGQLLNEPGTIRNQAGTPFRVFTAYWRAVLRHGAPSAPLRVPKLRFASPRQWGGSTPVALAQLGLEPRAPDWAAGLREDWTPGEAAGRRLLQRFLRDGLPEYAVDRDRPDRRGTSRLSPYLACGSISARQIWHAAHAAVLERRSPASHAQLEKFLAELGWREFNYDLLYHHPELHERNFQSRFDTLPWRTDRHALRAWQRGRTGYPIVDAGMRELWATGWMHNRVRMVAASFLIKHLLLDWRHGERWFWDTLVDADPANNAANWQWVAGSGADAAPYFRIFNPVLQGEKFDPEGAYVRRWVPELARLPAPLIHRPWEAPQAQLTAADVRLGASYPRPIVAHDFARRRALASIALLK